MEDEKYQRLKNYAFRLLAIRPRSTKELKGRLIAYSIKNGFPQTLTDTLTAELTRGNFLNDLDFANWWRDQRALYKPVGAKLIKIELRGKGVAEELIEEVFAKGQTQTSELEKAFVLITKKKKAYRYLKAKELKIKLTGFLYRRGFDWNVIGKVIDSVIQKE